ncbi:NAD-glutamate dehydrogenase [bacterium]|nr:NAD-glutamate dehydrogenase [bacterium]
MKSLQEIAKNSILSEDQLRQIEEIIIQHGQYTHEAVRKEIDWFCTGLGINEYYFQTTPLQTIANHIEALKAAEIMAVAQKEKILKIDQSTELENEATYLVDDRHSRAIEIEKRIEEKYPNCRLHSYRTLGKAMGVEHLRMYLVYNPSFNLEKIYPKETDLQKIADQSFLNTALPETKKRYKEILKKAQGWESPLIKVSRKQRSNELRIMVVTNRNSSARFFSNVSDVIQSHNLVSHRKYVEQFANGKTVYVFYLDNLEDPEMIQDLIEDISLVYVIPVSPLSSLFRERKLSAQETVFGVSAWSFAHQFLSEYNEEYLKLQNVLKDSPELSGILRNLKTRLAKVAYDEARVWDSLLNYQEFLKKAFHLFDKKFNPSFQDHRIDAQMDELREEIDEKITVEIDRNIFHTILTFIEVILKTNFFMKEKTSISFMLHPSFLNKVDYPEAPFGIFLIIGSEFRGFHIRFRDIARGGIRIVRSSNYQSYLTNSDFIFDENYNLASTQQKKNKDIPEGGSKGTILLRWGHQDKSESSFKKYVDGILDLILPSEEVTDYYGDPIILFLGPDEGTAELMEWACLRAQNREYPYWRAFSTGKPVELGGIPHDLYGMTTNSIHQYVLDILKKEKTREEDTTKVMTGGPDGDLGSNEILISKDKIRAVIDGSGVLYDPEGLNRQELTKLAKSRKMVENFNKNLLSKQGFLVTLQDRNIQLPDGEKVRNGLEFRNHFHLNPRFQADLFVPCGGRPNSVNINNWKELLDKKEKPRFKYIVEGANLFITQQARLRLEEKGVVIYKDASANKGGVTSSSLEVFAGLALSDSEFDQMMCVNNQKIPKFRKDYIQEILSIIKENASLEFGVIWSENQNENLPRPVLSDLISEKINRITDAVYTSDLFNERELYKKVIECCCPPVLVKKVGFQTILKRVPEAYLRAIFASRLASRYVYKYGLQASEVDFHEFLKEYK